MLAKRLVRLIHRTAVSLTLSLIAGITPGLAAADLASKFHFDIAPQELPTALLKYSEQSGIQIASPSEIVEGKSSAGVVGTLPARGALERLLSGTDLAYEVIDANTVAIRAAGSEKQRTVSTTVKTPDSSDRETAEEAQPQGFWSRFRLAQVDQGTNSRPSTVGSNTSASQEQNVKLEEVIVTAQKRSERLQDVPIPVTALNADTLVSSNQLRLQDYSLRVPALSVTPGYTGAPTLAIRGITTGTGGGNPTVGVVVDDAPFGSSTHLGGGSAVPDFDPSDLARIEVLRGPQGTLYGASSIGGLLKFVTVDPSTDGFTGRVQAGLSSVHNGNETGYNARGSVNVPLNETFALRASAFMRRDPGFIDDPTLGIDGVNRTDVGGGRLSALWRPSDSLSLKLNALYQHTDTPGSSLVYVQPGLGDLQQSAPRNSGYYKSDVQAYSAILKAKLGNAELTSVSGYSINKISGSIDFTPILGGLTENGLGSFPGFGTPGTSITDQDRTTKFTQEIRLAFSGGPKFDWLLGAFYTDERSPYSESILALDVPTGAVVGSWLYTPYPTTYKEYAAFADLTVHFTDRFDVQFGGRESENKQTYSSAYVGPYAPVFLGFPSPFVPPGGDTKANAFTYLVTPSFKVSPDLMVYARLASGYRPGGPNTNSTPNPVPNYKRDTTQNYEIGVKGSALDHALNFDASLYYIDWKDIQLQVFNGTSIYVNGSRAKSQGVEFSVESRPRRGLTLAAWAAWNDAVLTQDFPNTGTANAVGSSGDRLPNSSRFSGALSLDQEFPLTGAMTGFVGATLSYFGDRRDVFTSIFAASPERQYLPAYARTDLRGGARYETWTLNLFVNNATDRRGVVTGGIGATNPIAFTYIQPRTAGLSFSKAF